ncbi:MAG: dephospho-CoA kinase [Planctomycetota bacterium]|nr:dephospho-CoA kinase [Planctomycetota bacterium]
MLAGKPNDPPANGNEPLDRDPPAPAAEVENNALTSASTPATPRVVLGMLGGVGSGKSHVARRLAALGPGRGVAADALAHAAADGRLAEVLGSEFVHAGQPDVAALGARAFEDPAFLKALEALIHPAVHAAILAELARFEAETAPPVLVLDVPLLIEVGLDRHCATLWFVETLSLEEIPRREAFQPPLERTRARADRVIHNDVEPDALDDQVRTGLTALGIPPHQPQENGAPAREPSS